MKINTLKILPYITQYSDNSLILRFSPLLTNVILISDFKQGLNKNTSFLKTDPRTQFFNKFKKKR